MITRLEIDGFKTFCDFKMEFTPFTVIAGVNASGKSNIFDALALLSNLAEMDIRSAFKNLRGDPDEQFSQTGPGSFANQISIKVELLVDKVIKDNWGEEASLKYTRLRYEIVIDRVRNQKGLEDLKISHEQLVALKHQKDSWVNNNINTKYRDFWRPKVATGKRGKPYILTEEKNGKKVVKIPLDGKPGPGREFSISEIAQSALSSVNSVEFPHIFAAKSEMQNWQFLQLNPEDLRKPSSRMAPDRISYSGANLASTLYRLKIDDSTILNDISIELNNLLPNFIEVDVKEEITENRFIILLTSDDKRVFSSRVLSEGTLRILILCILKYDEQHKGIICFEEPENGIHPFRLELMIQLLNDLSVDYSNIHHFSPLRQIIVNTHSASFVAKVINKFSDKKEVSIWFSKLVTKVIPIENKTFKITKLIPVDNSYGQTIIDFVSESEKRMTDIEVKQFLESKDWEN